MTQKQSNKQFERFSKTLNKRRDIWVSESKIIHKNKYDYSKVSYSTQLIKVEIICPVHGSFFQRPADHKNQKQGCPKCSHNYPLSSDEFMAKSQLKFGNKFSLVGEFKGTKHPIELKCSDHGTFTLNKAETHLINDGCCPKCLYETRLSNLKPGNISKAETAWLNSLNVPERQYKLTINSHTFIADGYDPTTNTVYEFYGSYWHGNPNKYKPSDINLVINKSFGQLYEDTIAREKLIKSNFNLIIKWDSL